MRTQPSAGQLDASPTTAIKEDAMLKDLEERIKDIEKEMKNRDVGDAPGQKANKKRQQ